jgi:hypothetical protein
LHKEYNNQLRPYSRALIKFSGTRGAQRSLARVLYLEDHLDEASVWKRGDEEEEALKSKRDWEVRLRKWDE